MIVSNSIKTLERSFFQLKKSHIETKRNNKKLKETERNTKQQKETKKCFDAKINNFLKKL